MSENKNMITENIDLLLGEGELFLVGKRSENEEETKLREAKESISRKNIENAELKEYMRLHKKYGKK